MANIQQVIQTDSMAVFALVFAIQDSFFLVLYSIFSVAISIHSFCQKSLPYFYACHGSTNPQVTL